jgi:hypothetical protein
MHKPSVGDRLITIVVGQRLTRGFCFDDKEIAIGPSYQDIKSSSGPSPFRALSYRDLSAPDLHTEIPLELKVLQGDT